MDSLPEVLANSDYVCNILPSTQQTRGLLNGDVLKHCSDKVRMNMYIPVYFTWCVTKYAHVSIICHLDLTYVVINCGCY